VSPRKRRKSAGLTSLIAGAVSDRQRAAETTRRLESRAEVAWAGVAAKVEAAEAKERVRQDAKAAAERELQAGNEEAAAVTRTLQARVAELENLLASTLDADPYLTFGQLKEPAPVARFRPPPALATAASPPQLILPEPPRGIAALGRRRAHAQETAQKRAEYEQAAAARTPRRLPRSVPSTSMPLPGTARPSMTAWSSWTGRGLRTRARWPRRGSACGVSMPRSTSCPGPLKMTT